MAFELRQFPKEVLNNILQYELDLQFDNQLPEMLLALAPDKELFREALYMFKKINANVTVANEEEFKKMRMVELMKIRHVKLVWVPRTPAESWDSRICLQGHKVQLINNFATIRIDCAADQRPDRPMFSFLSGLVRASLSITKVVVRLRPGNYPGYELQANSAITHLSAELDVVGVMKVVNGDHIWTWEAPSGHLLDWIGDPQRSKVNPRRRI